MTPEILSPEGPELRPAQAVKLMDWLARSTSTRVISQLAVIVLTFIAVPSLALLGWAGIRMVGTLDRMEAQQTAVNDKVIAIQGKIQLLDLTDLHLSAKLMEIDGRLDNRITETGNRLDKRVDQVSTWEQQNALSIDNLKEKVYPLVPRSR
jgi:hypothetical protein